MTVPENSSEDPTSRLSDSVRRALELASAERDGELSASESEELATLRLSVGRQVREFRGQSQKISELVQGISLGPSEYVRDVISREVMRSVRSGMLHRETEQRGTPGQQDRAEWRNRGSDANRNRSKSANESVVLRQSISPVEESPNVARARDRRNRSVMFTAAASFAALFALLLVMLRSPEDSSRIGGSAEGLVATTAGDGTSILAVENVMSEPVAVAPMTADVLSAESKAVSNPELVVTSELHAAEGVMNHEDWQVLVVRVSSADPTLIHRRVEQIAAESGFLLTEWESRRVGSSREPSENAGVNFGVVLKPHDDRLPSETAEQAVSSRESVGSSSDDDDDERIHRFVEAITRADIVENEEWNPARIGELTREEALEAVRLSLLHPGSSESSLGEVYVAKPDAKNEVMKSARDSARDIEKPRSQPESLAEKTSNHSPILIVFQIE